MALLIACSKGCGEAIEVTEEMVAESAGGVLNVQHEVCPNDPTAKMRQFRIMIRLTEEVDAGDGTMKSIELAKMGETLEATSFKQAIPLFDRALGGQWNRIVGMSDIVDANSITNEGN